MLHVKGSLKALAKDFCAGLLEKGYFPHLFNTIGNYNYSGPIPDLKYFDLSSIAGSKKDYDEFHEWYALQTGEWIFKNELAKYCVNDVLVLAKIVEGYHDAAWANTGMSPWFNSTAPSFVHEAILYQKNIELELPEDPTEYAARVDELARGDFWAVLKNSEYWFAKEALRGGRTEIRKIYQTITPAEYAQGKRIRYQDICSQYPYQQVVHDFPTGIPKIHIFDRAYKPCFIHGNNKAGKCDCHDPKGDRYCDIVYEQQWTAQRILDDPEFFGIVCVTLVPPNDLFHPVLVTWDESAFKCIASLRPEDHVEIITTSVELVTALQHGYKLVKMHRYDKYKKTPSLWRDQILKFFIEKLVNSSVKPTLAELDEIANAYDARFGIGDEIRRKHDVWGKNPAKKQTAKIMMNSCWGKHCQRAVLPQSKVYNGEHDRDQIKDMFNNFALGNYKFKDAYSVDENVFMYQYITTQKTNPNLHNGYIPAGLFVPAYGRLQLWHELNRLGDRVLMNDTDSIVYLYDPTKYNIPQGSMLGEWELEDIDTQHGGIQTFVGLGPKSYAIKCFDGHTLVKAKGLSVKYASSSLVNFESLEKMVLDYLNDGQVNVIRVPQQTFTWSLARGMRTMKTLKDLKFNFSQLKGDLRHDTLYPFGHL